MMFLLAAMSLNKIFNAGDRISPHVMLASESKRLQNNVVIAIALGRPPELDSTSLLLKTPPFLLSTQII